MVSIKPKQKRSCISLFCGSGGLDTGFKQAGFDIGLAYDIDDAAIATHLYNHPSSSARKADLSVFSPEEIAAHWELSGNGNPLSGVIGGPPCQAFSVSNVHKRGNDPRARLPLHYAALLKSLNAKIGIDFFLFENVHGLLSRAHDKQLTSFRQLFEEAGFTLYEQALDAVSFGVPQYRPRVLIVGFNKRKFEGAEPYKFPIPKRTTLKTVRNAIGGLPEPTYFSRSLTAKDFAFHPNHWCLNPKSKKFTNGKLEPGGMWGRSFRTLEWDKPSWTVAYGHREVHVHPNCKRRLSIYEAMRLQGFPRDYRLMGTLTDQIRLVSDAVPPPLGKTMAQSIATYLDQVGPRRESRTMAQPFGMATTNSAMKKGLASRLQGM